MTAPTTTQTITLEPQELIVERVFDAPRELVFRAWTEPEHLKQWWGPAGWTVPHCTVDLRPGGKWHYCMRGPADVPELAGIESWGLTIYHEIVPPEKLVFTDAFSDAEGNLNSQMPQSRTTIEFKDEGGRTRVVNRTRYGTQAELDTVLNMGMLAGFTQTLDRLEAHLREVKTGAETITLMRVFEALPERVFRAWTEPAAFAQWFGAPGASVPPESVSMDVRPGGAWRATMLAGPEHQIHWTGRYVEVVPSERLVLTMTDVPDNEGEPLVVTFFNVDGRTQMVFRQSAAGLTPEDVQGATQGWIGFFDGLAALLAAA